MPRVGIHTHIAGSNQGGIAVRHGWAKVPVPFVYVGAKRFIIWIWHVTDGCPDQMFEFDEFPQVVWQCHRHRSFHTRGQNWLVIQRLRAEEGTTRRRYVGVVASEIGICIQHQSKFVKWFPIIIFPSPRVAFLLN